MILWYFWSGIYHHFQREAFYSNKPDKQYYRSLEDIKIF